jgi:hypothetical protein
MDFVFVCLDMHICDDKSSTNNNTTYTYTLTITPTHLHTLHTTHNTHTHSHRAYLKSHYDTLSSPRIDAMRKAHRKRLDTAKKAIASVRRCMRVCMRESLQVCLERDIYHECVCVNQSRVLCVCLNISHAVQSHTYIHSFTHTGEKCYFSTHTCDRKQRKRARRTRTLQQACLEREEGFARGRSRR